MAAMWLIDEQKKTKTGYPDLGHTLLHRRCAERLFPNYDHIFEACLYTCRINNHQSKTRGGVSFNQILGKCSNQNLLTARVAVQCVKEHYKERKKERQKGKERKTRGHYTSPFSHTAFYKYILVCLCKKRIIIHSTFKVKNKKAINFTYYTK